jgi:hypothetical protein
MKMYNILKNVINRKVYNFKEMLTKIDTLWSENKLTDAEREELLTLAQNNASAEHSVDVIAKLIELEQRIKVVEEGKTENSNTAETIEDFVEGKWYYNGNKVLFNGKVYECTADANTVVYWSPAQSGLCWKQLN